MVNKDFFQALDLLEQEKKISREKMIEALEAGILFAFKKEYGFRRFRRNKSYLLYVLRLPTRFRPHVRSFRS